MKRLLALNIVLLYLVLTGISIVNLHYCQGQLIEVDFIGNTSTCCAQTDNKQSSCCENVKVVIDFNTDRLVASIINISVFFNDLPFELYQCFGIYSAEITSKFFTDDSPPGKNPQKIYLLNHSFVFYG